MKLKPTKAQLDFLSWEFGIFFHFGIRAFFPGHRDWDGKEMPAKDFNPKELDCEQWIKMVKDAGATYAIMTAKHHDGFSLWPSKYSQYSVSDSSWKDGKGDVVREFKDACRKYGIKVGLYYSPAQWGSHKIDFKCEKEYDDYFINQISELTDKLQSAVDDLSVERKKIKKMDSAYEKACHVRDIILPKMQEIRSFIDKLEVVVAKKYWPFPTYGDLLFY